tara:strand:+ start:151 stop:381 length:231 start_codon:yes stop_codon:yes gene_type:complete
MIWTKKHDEAIQKTYEDLVAKLEGCESRKQCQQALADEGWDHGTYNEFAPVTEVLRKVLANHAILEHCRKQLVAVA